MTPPGPAYPFTAFSFAVEIYPGADSAPLVGAAFAECDGIDMTHEVKTIREGGANDRQIRLNGSVAYGTVTLKRGMTEDLALWNWFQSSIADPGLRAGARSEERRVGKECRPRAGMYHGKRNKDGEGRDDTQCVWTRMRCKAR